MAQEERDKPSKVPPPKIQLGSKDAGAQAGKTGPVGPVPPKPAIPVGKPSEAKKSTSRIDLAAAAPLDDFSKAATMPIAVPAQPGEAPTQEPTSEAPTVVPLTPEEKMAVAKKATVRIEIPADLEQPPTPEDLEAAKRTTARVIIDEERAKGDTTRIEPTVPEPSEVARKRTARIDLGEVVASEEPDIFKRRTTVLDASTLAAAGAGQVPRTIRIKRPEGAAATTQVTPITPVAPTQVEAARKSETARIDLPPAVAATVEEQPPTRKKTIRIKRPGAAGPTAVVVKRPVTEEVSEELPSAEAAVHPAFTWVAAAAVLVTLILIYVLVAQVGTVASLTPPRLPYFGAL